MELIIKVLIKMAERLRNWILQDSYLNIFQNLLYICIYILHIQISFNNAFQKIYHTMRIFFQFWIQMRKNLSNSQNLLRVPMVQMKVYVHKIKFPQCPILISMNLNSIFHYLFKNVWHVYYQFFVTWTSFFPTVTKNVSS